MTKPADSSGKRLPQPGDDLIAKAFALEGLTAESLLDNPNGTRRFLDADGNLIREPIEDYLRRQGVDLNIRIPRVRREPSPPQ